MVNGGTALLGEEVMLVKYYPIIAVIIPLVGCVSPQLKENTLATASTIEDMRVTQLLTNVSEAIDHHDAVPSQLIPPSGQTADTQTGMLTLGIAPHEQKSISAVLGGNENNTWNVSPISDPRDLLNLQALYSLLYRRDADIAYTVYETGRLYYPDLSEKGLPIPDCGVKWDKNSHLPNPYIDDPQKALAAYFNSINAYQYYPAELGVGEQLPPSNCYFSLYSAKKPTLKPNPLPYQGYLLAPQQTMALSSPGYTVHKTPVAIVNAQYGLYYPTSEDILTDLRNGISANCRHYHFKEIFYPPQGANHTKDMFARWLFWMGKGNKLEPYDPTPVSEQSQPLSEDASDDEEPKGARYRIRLHYLGQYGGRRFWTTTRACLSEFVIIAINSTANSYAAAQASPKAGNGNSGM
jgi:hypothetical protein